MLMAMLAALALALPGVAQAQFSDGYNFLKAVKERDGAKATELIDRPGSTLINTKDYTSGETALHIVVKRRDTTWLGFLLSKGANPDVADSAGETPLLAAVQLRFVDAVRYLLAYKANINKANDNGETPLIRAVQLRDLALVRFLVAEGADPDKRDTLAGMSARDYAQRDGRTPGLVEALAGAKLKSSAPVQGPRL
jgi:ankyrin repeat protein